ncbi:hypothetical protein LTR84_007124 [Exophiala bonariae]|uniref:Enoyl reductase (ER) domain-containing protein n=1 Tax=Exophiala bonariae TaxID=1690606 RepID=A0AAV9N285_9EURO|nr:hypothetical protein LTR84_007124 [Exophiala bonariae]
MGIAGIPSMMTAAQVVQLNKPHELNQVETFHELRSHDLLIKTVAASLCHTDLMIIDGTLPASLPMTASHEGAGIVIATGDAVNNIKVGERVMSGLPLNLCGQCEDCLGPEDRVQYCKHTEGSIGLGMDGAFADYHVADSRTTSLIPDTVNFAEAAALACAGRTVYRAIKICGLGVGDYLAIIGAGGGLGHLGVQFAQAKGFKVIAIDARDASLELCKEIGADHVLDARDGQHRIIVEVQKITGTSGANATLNLSAHPTATQMACAVTKDHGTMIQVAGPEKTTISIFDLVFRDINIKGTMLAGSKCSAEMLEEYAKHGLKVQMETFHGLRQVPEMVLALHSGALKGKAVCVVDADRYAEDIAQ